MGGVNQTGEHNVKISIQGRVNAGVASICSGHRKDAHGFGISVSFALFFYNLIGPISLLIATKFRISTTSLFEFTQSFSQHKITSNFGIFSYSTLSKKEDL